MILRDKAKTPRALVGSVEIGMGLAFVRHGQDMTGHNALQPIARPHTSECECWAMSRGWVHTRRSFRM